MLVHEIVKKKLVEGDVGVEIEVEGNNLPHESTDKYWKYTEDGSLRGESAEYVFKKPLPVAAVPKAMQELNAYFTLHNSTLEFSFRTSVHVHVNVGGLEYDELLAFMYAYLLLERPLMRYCGDERLGNRFCLRFEDAEGLEDTLRSMIRLGEKGGIQNIPADQNRYAAMNVDALKKFGSLEFRGMRGTNDEQVVSNWAKALVNLRNYASNLGNPKEVYDAFCHFGPEAFVRRALGDVSAVFVYDDMVADLRSSFSITLDFPFYWEEVNTKPKLAPNLNILNHPVKFGDFLDVGAGIAPANVHVEFDLELDHEPEEDDDEF